MRSSLVSEREVAELVDEMLTGKCVKVAYLVDETYPRK
jgi:hypothetical protein